MKKTVVLLVTFILIMTVAPSGMATDICSDTPLETANYNVEITSAVNLRTVSCMEESSVVAVLSKGEVVHVIGKTEGWHKVQRADGTTGWIWETFVTSTTKPFTPTGSSEPFVNEPLYDIVGHKYEDAIRFIYEQGIVSGYADGSYQPDKTINRAEITKIIVEAAYGDEFNLYSYTDCFDDVVTTDWFEKYVCYAKVKGIVTGYDSVTFKPTKAVNFVEALKIVMVGYGEEYQQSDPWYKKMVELASENNIIPLDVKGFDQVFTRGQMAELITRNIKYKDTTLNEYLGDKAGERVTYEMLDW
ncbi:S-layer homology domain-containing protein [Candidatus Peregrinibacteria bacterium]|nr:S-layer homology domain-containing protein [Candidatus Peregrinibacteria bacterium]